jgi:hypothetical protein
MRLSTFSAAAVILTAATLNAQTQPLAMSASIEALGGGSDGTVMGIVLQIAPEDRDRAGERVRVVSTLVSGAQIVDRQTGVITWRSVSPISTARPPVSGSVRSKFQSSSIHSKPRTALPSTRLLSI